MLYATALEAAAAVRLRKISARELVELAFGRIDQTRAINAIVWECRAQALQRATAADTAIARRESWGALHGVPITIKETFAYAGSPSTWGRREWADALSTRTAPAIERLEAAGAIVLGKTNVPEMLTDWQSYNDVYGTTSNPWDLTRTAGGSSGGSSAALAAGIGYLTMGSDIGGSIRIPAHFCNLFGHKPTLHLVSLQGHVPGAWHGEPIVDAELPVAGPLARSARDLALVVPGPAPRRKRLGDYKVGYVLEEPLQPELRAIYESMIDNLRRQGVTLTEGWPVDPAEQYATYRYMLDAFLDAVMPGHRKLDTRYADWLAANERRIQFRQAWAEYFRTHDVFLMPAAFTAAFPHDHSARDVRTLGHCHRMIEGRPYRDLLYWAHTASLTGLPATVAPIGQTAQRLPAGIQILGPYAEDLTPIDFADKIYQLSPWPNL